MAHTEKNEVLMAGGVARNRRLCEMAKLMAEARGAQCFVPPASLCTDNGAMIAWTGIVMHKSGVRMKLKDTQINQKFRTDDVEVKWRKNGNGGSK
jgi:tRNA A37 threonylcarbamoyltransferase TsaD